MKLLALETLEQDNAPATAATVATTNEGTPAIAFVTTAGGIAAALSTSTKQEKNGDECFSDGPQCDCWKTPGRTCSTCQ
ncbi:MAG: hypothetical protein WC004_03820 [Candidatus Absconditabacterales bacterium]